MTILAGEREHGQTTFELVYDNQQKLDLIALRRWRRRVGGGFYDRDFMSIEISDDPVLRERLVASFAAALGVPYTTSDRRRALEADARAERQGAPVTYAANPQWRKQGSALTY